MPAGTGDDEVCVTFARHFRDRFGGRADRRLYVGFRVKPSGLEFGHLQAHLALYPEPSEATRIVVNVASSDERANEPLLTLRFRPSTTSQ